MDHPAIAKVFDAGATPQGQPYFVMELVKGIPITDFCDQNQLTPRERLHEAASWNLAATKLELAGAQARKAGHPATRHTGA